MYRVFYNFKEKPFSLTPDPRYIFFSEVHQEALDHIMFGISQREGFMAITGGIGTGKTTLCRALLETIDSQDKVALILNPMLSSSDLLRALVQDIGAKPQFIEHKATTVDSELQAGNNGHGGDPAGKWTPEETKWLRHASKKELLDALNDFLLAQYAMGGSTIVIIDEAQNLSLDVLEQVRLLSNLETEKQKLLQIIFVGQTEFNEKLGLPQLKQLNQRISVRYELKPLSADETRTYIYHRLRVASAVPRVTFSRTAFKAIHSYTQGYPRLINLVCDRALLAGYNARDKCIDAKHVRQAIKSLLGDDGERTKFDFIMKLRLAVAASILFFIAGTMFFVRGDTAYLQTIRNLKHSISSMVPFGAGTEPGVTTEFKPMTPTLTAPSPQTKASSRKASDQRDSQSGGEEKIIKLPLIFSEQTPEELYRIQISSWTKKSKAARILGELEGKGYPAYIRETTRSGKPWYVVYAGPYEDVKTARTDLSRLANSGVEPILLSYNPKG